VDSQPKLASCRRTRFVVIYARVRNGQYVLGRVRTLPVTFGPDHFYRSRNNKRDTAFGTVLRGCGGGGGGAGAGGGEMTMPPSGRAIKIPPIKQTRARSQFQIYIYI